MEWTTVLALVGWYVFAGALSYGLWFGTAQGLWLEEYMKKKHVGKDRLFSGIMGAAWPLSVPVLVGLSFGCEYRLRFKV